MNTELDKILNDDENNKPKTVVESMIYLLESLRVEFRQSIEPSFEPVYKKQDPIDVLLLPDLRANEKVIMMVLRNKECATVNQLMMYADIKKGAVNNSLRRLVSFGYVQKIKQGTYALQKTNIY